MTISRLLPPLLACAVLALSVSAPVLAHDFWLQPERFRIAPDALTPFTLQVGHGSSRQRSPIPLRRIARFAAVGADGASVDLRKSLADGTLAFKQAGTWLLVLETDNHAHSHLPAQRFNAHLHAEGLTPALAERARRNRAEAEGSESYSRIAKAIVQVGPRALGADRAVTAPIGLPLEIVPEADPYAQPQPERLSVSVLYLGKPLAGATVKFTNLDQDAEPFETRISDNAGGADFTMPTSGRWLMNVVWTRTLPRSSDTDFDTVFSSLSFGFE